VHHTRNSASHIVVIIIMVTLHTAYHLGDARLPVQVILHRHGNVDMIQLNPQTITPCVQCVTNNAVNIVLNGCVASDGGQKFAVIITTIILSIRPALPGRCSAGMRWGSGLTVTWEGRHIKLVSIKLLSKCQT